MTVTVKKKLPNRPHVYTYETPELGAVNCIGVAHDYDRSFGQKIRILRPQLDKLTLLIDVPDEEERQDRFGYILNAALDKDTSEVSKVKKGDFAWGAVKNLVYDLKLRIDVGQDHQLVTVAVGPKWKGKVHLGFIRMELSPANLGPKGMKKLKKSLIHVLGVDPWITVIKRARVSRYDVAVDFVGAKARELLVFEDKKLKSTSVAYYSKRGRLETLYLQQPGSYIYDKRKQLLDSGLQPQFGAKVAHTRLEIRRKPTSKGASLFNLLKASNPLLKFRVHDCFKSFPEIQAHHSWLWFVDSCRHRGIEKALALSKDEEVCADLDSCLEECRTDVFPAKEVWATWKSSLLATGLFDEN